MLSFRNALLASGLSLLAISAVRVRSVALHEVAILAACVVAVMFGARATKTPLWLTFGSGLLLLGAASSFLAAGAPGDSLGKVIAFVAIPIAVGWLVLQSNCLDPVRTGLLSLLGVVTAYALLQWLGVAPELPWQTGGASPQQYLDQGRIPGHTLSPNLLAMELVSGGILLLGFLQRKALTWALLALPIAWVLFLTRSRASWIGAAAGAAYLVWYLLRKHRVWQRLWIGFTVTVAVGVVYAVSISTDPSATSRAEIWSYTWQLLQESPIWGGSFSGFQEAVSALAQGNPSFLVHGLPYAVHPHQLFLATWWHTGLMGLIGLVVLFVGSLWKVPTNWLSACAQAALVAIAANGMLDRTIWQADLAILAAVAFALVARGRYAA